MSQARSVAVIVGSLRKDSATRKVAQALAALTPQLKFEIIEIGDLPHFDQDL
ncbi:NAD(P)H-dependent oxidoreductase, partial [Phenylobacterium sp.]|uniref:NADPH-dependent FMN reductase n=1 Tax=Phenylobacterium sp. TaxID=1871053 RepID=UPI0028113A4D